MTYAHSVNDAGQRHDLVEHLRAVAESAAAFADPFDASTLAYYAGLWHDLGKFHPEFQAYLRRCEANQPAQKVDHKAAGAHDPATRCGKHLAQCYPRTGVRCIVRSRMCRELTNDWNRHHLDLARGRDFDER